MNESLVTPAKDLFLNPFAENGEEMFDPMVAHQKLWERYQNHEIEHDYTADKFVADTQALMMDAAFVGRFEQAALIAAQMHILCGEDHNLQQSLQANSFFNQTDTERDHHGHNHQAADEESSKKKKQKKKNLRRGWLDWFIRD